MINESLNETLKSIGSEATSSTMMSAKQAVENGFSQGFQHGYSMIKYWVWIFLLTHLLEWIVVKIARHPDSPDKYRNKVLPKVRSNVFVVRVGLCIAMIFKLYITSIGGV